MQENEKDTRVYELAYLFVPTIAEDKIAAKFGDVKALLEKGGAAFISEDMPKMIELAYEMNRTIDNKKTWFASAYFGWIKFELEPAQLASFEEVLKRDEEVLRYMIIKTVRENTIASKRTMSRPPRMRENSEEAPAVVSDEPTATPEEIDEQIDALVTE